MQREDALLESRMSVGCRLGAALAAMGKPFPPYDKTALLEAERIGPDAVVDDRQV